MLRDLYVADLNQTLDSLRQMLLEWPVLSARAELPAIRAALDEHYTDTRRQVDRVQALLAELEERPRAPEFDPLAPLVRLCRARYAEVGGADVRHLALVTSAMLFDYHLLAGYGAACAGGRALGHGEGIRVLTVLVAEQKGWLDRLTTLREAVTLRLGAAPQPVDDPASSLMPGVWETETSGFASVPPRASSDLGAAVPPLGGDTAPSSSART